MDILSSLNWRYATQKFDPEARIPEETFRRLLEAMNLTATSFGLQSYKVLILEDKEKQAQLLKATYHQSQVVDADKVLVFCIPTVFDDELVKRYIRIMGSIRGTSEDKLERLQGSILRTLSGYEPRQIREWMIRQVYLVVGNLLTICALEQIDCCPMEGFIPSEYVRLLNLDQQGLEPVLLLPLGYRSATDPAQFLKKVRVPLEDILFQAG